ncbi:MAG: type ISP restriction/modification enzyme [Coriobacteriia bacterium]|nr:type ISP restriction/modification enzyme [Coriobacteriia bacterium]
MSDPVESYFSELRDIRSSGAGVAEISYYDPLKQLLNEVGKHLKPKVRALMQLRNTGSGNPDGGLFTANQLKGWEPGVDPLLGQLPARGAIEVKGTADDAFAVAASEQVARYVERYGLVLVTNLRDFVLVGKNAEGTGVRTLESCSLATSEAAFWAKVQQPRKYAEDAGEGLTEFLRRVLLHNAPLSDPKDLAWFLASYARTARLRLEQKHELPALDALRAQLEDALGLKFEGEKGDHFFRSTLVQTLFYGMFAAWVLWARDRDREEQISWESRFQWETATATLHVPMVYELFRQFADVRQLGALGISEVLEWAEEILWRIDRKAFFEKFKEEHAVQYFYEPFLQAFDPQLRKELGVWYTPDEVVKYMVARVDWALREELGIADGLADPSVVVLDPCCGTGAYLVEVLRTIDETLQAKGADALTRQDVKRAAMERVIGFEIMPAPFVVAHLQLGILLAELGVPLRDADERAAVYLTNALTGWNRDVAPPKEKRGVAGQLHSTLLFPEFAEERDAADRVKREEQILVVIGNPPYNGFAGMAVDEERDLSDAYRTTKLAPKPQGQGLNDLYVRFFRMAERQIVERSGRGVVCLISNNSWLDSLSFTGMRERFLEVFDHIWIDNLNGDKYRTGKLTPEGKPDPSIFSTEKNHEGIQVGTAIGLLVRNHVAVAETQTMYRDFWGADKTGELAADASRWSRVEYEVLSLSLDTGLPFVPGRHSAEFFEWPAVPDLMPVSFSGVTTARDDLLVSSDRDELESRMAGYFDPNLSDAELALLAHSSVTRNASFDGPAVRRRLQERGIAAGEILQYGYRPFDLRWLYWERSSGLLDRNRQEFRDQVFGGNAFLFTTGRTRKGSPEPAWFTPHLNDYNCLDSGARGFPLFVAGADPLLNPDMRKPNISDKAQLYLDGIGGNETALFYHSLATLHSVLFREENAGALRHSWPRIPLPKGGAVLDDSASLGLRVASLLDVATQARIGAPGGVGVLSSSQPLDPSVDLAVTARWGIAGKGGITMPSTGKLTERPYTTDELAAIADGVESLGMSAEQTIALLGETCFDVYLNDVAYWRCVPANVWRYTIGGYQVIKKWLSYRERALLGRDLKPEEARYVTEMVRRIAALVLMQPELDANYERVKADVWEWGT